MNAVTLVFHETEKEHLYNFNKNQYMSKGFLIYHSIFFVAFFINLVVEIIFNN